MEVNPDASHRSQIITPHDGLYFNVLELSIVVKAVAEGYTIYEAQVPPYFAGLPTHVHRETTEWHYILGGTLAFTLNEETSVARTGTLILVHPRVVHTFWNPAAIPATLLSGRSQPNFAEYLTQLTELLANAGSWPSTDTTPILTLAAQYDQFLPGRKNDEVQAFSFPNM